jgi:tetratricopeptide (TPR) repeat protein
MEQLAGLPNSGPTGILQQLETGNRRLLLLTDLGQYPAAIEVAQAMLALAKAEKQTAWTAQTLTNIGIIFWRQGDPMRAQLALQEALGLIDDGHDSQLQATCLNYLGLIHSRLSDYGPAREHYQQALQLYRDASDRAGEAGCANNLGLLEAILGRYQAAQQHHTQALSICRTIGDRHLEGISLNLLGGTHLALGNVRHARTFLERSLTIRQAIGDRRGEAFCLHDLGLLYLALNEAERALTQFEVACKIRLSLGEVDNHIASLAALGQAALDAGQLQVAGEALQAAVAHLENGGNSGEYPPQQIWWIYARWCTATKQLDSANQAQLTAYQLVTAQADQIRDPAYRLGYLEQVRLHAEIIETSLQNEV